MRQLLSGVLVVFSLLLIALGVAPIIQQREQLSGSRPVTVRVLSRLQEKPVKDHKSGEPDSSLSIQCIYQWNGQTYKTPRAEAELPSRISPVDLRTRLLSKPEDEQVMTGYIDPNRPVELQFPEPMPSGQFISVLASMLILVIGILGLVTRDAMQIRSVRIPVQIGGVFPMKPTYAHNLRRLVAGLISGVWNLVAWAVAIGYYYDGRIDIPGTIAVVLALIVGLAALGFFFYYHRVDARVKSSYVSVSLQPAVVGQPVSVHLEQIFTRTLKLNEVRIGILCLHTKKQPLGSGGLKLMTKTRIAAQQWREVLIKRGVKANQRINLNAALVVPPEGRKSTKIDRNQDEWYSWQLRLHLIFRDGPDYREEYPIIVEDHMMVRDKEQVEQAAMAARAKAAARSSR